MVFELPGVISPLTSCTRQGQTISSCRPCSYDVATPTRLCKNLLFGFHFIWTCIPHMYTRDPHWESLGFRDQASNTNSWEVWHIGSTHPFGNCSINSHLVLVSWLGFRIAKCVSQKCANWLAHILSTNYITMSTTCMYTFHPYSLFAFTFIVILECKFK